MQNRSQAVITQKSNLDRFLYFSCKFQVMNDAKLMSDVLYRLVDVDYSLTVSVMKILSAALLV